MKNIAPYQIFFPIGIFCSILAVGVWFVQDLNWFSAPAIFIHSRLIVGGFIWSFIVGFLMTAIPRMTGTSGVNIYEFATAVGLIIFQIIQAWALDGRWFYGTNIAVVVFLLFYGGRRILKSVKPIPVFFSHVGLAMTLAILGGIYHFQGNSYMGTHLYHVGTILLLVLGIGTRFFSFLSGLPSEFENASKVQHLIFHTLGIFVCGALFFSGSGHTNGYLGLFILTLIYLLFIWRVFRSSDRPSALKYGVRIVAATIPVTFLMCWLQPLLYITWLHMLFIGCFGLITFAVATRVTLAHGSYSTDLEMKSKALWYVVGFLSLGVLSRVLYGFSDGL
ncbi:MAG: NnrS family protein, partial [Bdellovibrionales bacterium]|nr:NnrS family protein [Bdellovibrionales bacterium]